MLQTFAFKKTPMPADQSVHDKTQIFKNKLIEADHLQI